MPDTPLAIEKIYTDGACSGNPGPGGWGVVFYLKNGQVHELGGGADETTNNRMELQAAIAALEFLQKHPQSSPVSLFTDSEYVKKGATQWISGWKRRGWKTAQGKDVLNQDLWMALDQANPKAVDWFYVRGHSGDPGNERCDAIARGFATQTPPQLKHVNWSSSEDAATEDAAKCSSNAQSKAAPAKVAKKSAKNSNIVKEKGITDKTDTPLRLERLHALRETLRFAHEIAQNGYLLSSQELADLVQLECEQLEVLDQEWSWRNWRVYRVSQAPDQVWWRLAHQPLE